MTVHNWPISAAKPVCRNVMYRRERAVHMNALSHAPAHKRTRARALAHVDQYRHLRNYADTIILESLPSNQTVT